MENTKNAVHKAAQQGFEKEAQAYARGRPDYPAALSAWLAQALGLGPGREVADVGAGTGKFTALLATTGATVVGVEPVDAMRAKIDALQLPTLRAVAGTAQAIPLPSCTLDAVVCAQAFHWFATREALDEFHRVLRPGGKLGLVWNVRDESVDWVAELTTIITPTREMPRASTRATGASPFRTPASARWSRPGCPMSMWGHPSRSSWTASCRSASSQHCPTPSAPQCARRSRH